MKSFAIVFLAFLPFCLGSATPGPVVKLCKPDDPDLKSCWLKCGHLVATSIVTGVPSRNIPPTQPLYVPRHELKAPTFSAVFTNLKFDGLSTYTIDEVVPHASDNSVIYKGSVRDLKLESDVTSKGNLGDISLDGSGKIKIDFENITVNFKLEWETLTVGGVKYHNVFGEIEGINYGVTELRHFDIVNAEALEKLKQTFHQEKAAVYLHVLEESFFKHLLRYILRAYNAFAVSD